MSFYLMSEALTCFGLCSGAYQSLKFLHQRQATTAESGLQLWAVLGTLYLYQQYAEMFVSWLPFYYWLKTALLIALLTPKTNVPKLAFDALVVPLVEASEAACAAHVMPALEHLAVRHGKYLHQVAMRVALSSLSSAELEKLEVELKRRLDQVQVERNVRDD
ncbi:hypothetical protein ACHHYP_11035 [Achlya hypogyna]|uniref:Uncharacterized protein n=1 Tax=Achlya hypogyna TaxID=1202772 RepID=A0A1V9YK30_ACHHY|nr:hypothetical protein ACHHYP_11035 [Achlya hypogyna]